MFLQNQIFDHKFFNTVFGKALREHPFKIDYFTIDSRSIIDPTLTCFIGIKGPNFNGNDFFEHAYQQGVRVFILEQVPVSIPHDATIYIVTDSIQALAELASAHRKRLNIPHILITGSFGKTTVRHMLMHLLNQKYSIHTAHKNWNNDIGLPLSILSTPHEAQISILEAGMNHAKEISLLSKITKPEIGIVTNIGWNHVGQLGSMDAIANAKAEIIDGMSSNSILIFNKNNPYKNLLLNKFKGKVIFFDPDKLYIHEDYGIQGFTFKHYRIPNEQFYCPCPGIHLLENIAILFVCMEIFNIPVNFLQECLNLFSNHLEHRMDTQLHKKSGAMLILDCYNASLESFKAGFNILKKEKLNNKHCIAVIGDILELGTYSDDIHKQIINDLISKKCIDELFIMGTYFSKHSSILKNHNINYYIFNSLNELSEKLITHLRKDTVVFIKASHGFHFENIVKMLY
ncbi:UDP-N-acetylmuramoyl-tripeptide--D-alanyl-D-alanine ligase [Brevinema andersonii]|uniref:UDP-N-acetylmuramoyl-tripeptide--D-alanyl-D-alanine ligase n=1 Tax=Brevinema andersonii TaxID=34097 RepID=A0A1I1EHJ9_BREAD|nr:UDP-N-acetylmuramoyl-tripeptide--D-alanyl-D-alanine ligase [Brevinema andersonii]SFB84858.1 UDP-N-acetylmuramoyl-tripeptide--D-alanyl-D-alanine ligase [Brevinema andersonii]